ncbi:MAG: phosphoribosylformylglycinamidine synthase subunit PurL [Candidatus Methylacidiphilales bacterium]
MPSITSAISTSGTTAAKSSVPAEVAITPKLIESHGITPDEYQRIIGILGREPNITELGIFSVMWSEHCSYKNSRLELKKFPTTGPTVLVKAGDENAGVIDIGGGWGVAFKIESHNHPSAVEPFQGAATGVGGILRDIFTMGARPVFLLNSLRFGNIRGDSADARNNRRLVSGVVAGIAHYGNCIGVPTVGGEIVFDESYHGNPLVNVFCLGILRHSEIRRGKATGTGNPVFYVGARTGRDGLAGAAFASRDLTEDSKADRPAVQVGDPFMEKLLLEACLELFKEEEAVVGVQDMGAAGLTCSTCETASRGGTGIEIELDLVPQREPGMTPYETMLSESQERMLIIVRKGHEATVKRIFDKWDLPNAEIGMVTDDGMMRVKHHGVTVAEIPARQLADEAPVYQRDARPPADLAERQTFDFNALTEPADLHAEVLAISSSPTVASKRWIYRQFDHMVRVGTVVTPGCDAAVVRVETDDGWKYLASTVDCNGHYCWVNPREGGRHAVVEAARNLAMTGATPIAVTDNLNFGNPHIPEIFYQLREGVEGLAEACRFFELPVTGGNVSLYNQSPRGAINPTPTIGMVGIIHQERHITRSYFQRAGDVVLLLGGWGWEVSASLYARELRGLRNGQMPEIHMVRERLLQEAVRQMIDAGGITSAHDISDGGAAVTLVECCVGGPAALGAKITLPDYVRTDIALFNETQARAILSVEPIHAQTLLALAAELGVHGEVIGTVESGPLTLVRGDGSTVASWKLSELEESWGKSLGREMDRV